MNRDGSVTTQNNPQGDGPRGEQGGEGSRGGAGGPRNTEDLATEVMQLRELVERLSSRQGSDVQEELVIEFQEFDKYAKIHNFGKAVEADSFEKLKGVTNYQGWLKAFKVTANIYSAWDIYKGHFDSLADTTDAVVSRKFKRVCCSALAVLQTACNRTV